MFKPLRRINWMNLSGLLVGVFITFAAIVFCSVLYIRMVTAGVIGVEEYKLFSYFEKAQGLHVGTDVQISGVSVGHISKIEIDPSGKVKVEFTIRKEFMPWITDRATIYPIRDQNVISERVVTVDVRKGEGRTLEDGEMITAGKAQDIETVLETLNEVLERVTILIDAADTLVALTMDTGTTIGALLGSKMIYEKLNTQLDRLDHFSYQGLILLDDVSRHLPNILHSTDTLTQNLNAMVKGLEDTPQKVNRVFASFDDIFHNLNGTLDSLNHVVGTVSGMAVQGEETLQNAEDLMNGLSNIWIVRRNLPKRDSIPFTAEDAW